MVNYIELNDSSLRCDEVNDTAARVCREEGYSGCVYSLPKSGGVIVAASPGDGTGEYETERVFKHIAFELGVAPEDGEDGNPFAGEDDCDFDLIDGLPAPEDEIGPIWLRFSINNIGRTDKSALLARLCSERGYECVGETDGATVYLEYLVALDLYFDENADYIDGELDASYAGAGLFAEGCEFARELAKRVGGKLEFVASSKVSYPIDNDFEKLRQLFYSSIRQQLAFALADDRDGLQAYIGWSVDTYEPEDVPGSIVTHLGRVSIEKLKYEIQTYGFEAVADRHFLMRGGKNGGAGEYLKTAVALLWCDISPERIRFRAANDSFKPEKVALEMLEKAIGMDRSIPIPLYEYELLHRLDKSPISVSALSHPQYQPHYPIGYLRGDIYYGFGSYLRRFRLPGGFCPKELVQGQRVRFEGITSNYIYARIDVSLDYSGREPMVDEFIPDNADTQDFDLGGSSFCRLGSICDGSGCYSYAVIAIRDESYYFRLLTDDRDFQTKFTDIISGCRAVEDVDDLPPVNPEDKPRAWGACYFQPQPSNQPSVLMSYLMNEAEKFFKLPEIQLSLVNTQTTDITSKLGGVPYSPRDRKVPLSKDGTPLDFVLQLNFAELNPSGFLENFPQRGILQLWMEDFEAMFASGSRVYDQSGQSEGFKLVWYPEPSGGYITEPNGAAFIANESLTFPTTNDYRFSELINNFNRYAAKNPDVEQYTGCFALPEHEPTHIGGSPDLIGDDPRLGDPKLRDKSELLMQLRLPDSRGWLDIFIASDKLEKRDFSDAVMVVFTPDGDK